MSQKIKCFPSSSCFPPRCQERSRSRACKNMLVIRSTRVTDIDGYGMGLFFLKKKSETKLGKMKESLLNCSSTQPQRKAVAKTVHIRRFWHNLASPCYANLSNNRDGVRAHIVTPYCAFLRVCYSPNSDDVESSFETCVVWANCVFVFLFKPFQLAHATHLHELKRECTATIVVYIPFLVAASKWQHLT